MTREVRGLKSKSTGHPRTHEVKGLKSKSTGHPGTHEVKGLKSKSTGHPMTHEVKGLKSKSTGHPMTREVKGLKSKSTGHPLVELARLAQKNSRSTRAQDQSESPLGFSERGFIVTAGRVSVVLHRKRKAVMESEVGKAVAEMHMD